MDYEPSLVRAPTSHSVLSAVASPVSSSASSVHSDTSTGPQAYFGRLANPMQLDLGRQREGAPMCPCHDCWEYGSHVFAPARRPKAPKAPKEGKTPKEKKSLFHFLSKNSKAAATADDLEPEAKADAKHAE